MSGLGGGLWEPFQGVYVDEEGPLKGVRCLDLGYESSLGQWGGGWLAHDL